MKLVTVTHFAALVAATCLVTPAAFAQFGQVPKSKPEAPAPQQPQQQQKQQPPAQEQAKGASASGKGNSKGKGWAKGHDKAKKKGYHSKAAEKKKSNP